MKKNRIRATASFIVNCLAAKNYDLLRQFEFESELPPEYVENAVVDYGGAVTLAPDDRQYRIDAYRHADIKNKLFVDIRLWFDGEESDLTLQCTFYTEALLNGLYQFSITDLDVL